MISLDDTIAAVATAVGPAARGIIRLSGPHSKSATQAVFHPRDRDAWHNQQHPRQFHGRLLLPADHIALPSAACVWPGNRSYTGQPVVELHTLGCPPILQAALETLYRAGIRPAQAGEFTLRAFLAQRIDLVQAEAVLGVIDAADHCELDQALRQLAGGISSRIREARTRLLELLADLEAGLDFVEEDIEFVEADAVIERLESVRTFVDQLRQQSRHRMRTTAACRIVLAGQTNAGKSTLFNRLIGEHTALVSQTEGTTRDYLSARLDWDGPESELIDTAGWEADASGVLSQAQTVSREQWERADLIVWCRATDMSVQRHDADEQLQTAVQRLGCPVLLVHTKSDLRPDGNEPLTDSSPSQGPPQSTVDNRGHTLPAVPLQVSGHTGQGLGQLCRQLARQLQHENPTHRSLISDTSARCRDSLHNAHTALTEACGLAHARAGDELLAVSIREALDHLGRIVGAVYTEDLLDHIFSRFCIGK